MGGHLFSRGSVLIARYLRRHLVISTRLGGRAMKKPEEVMEILEAYDLAGTLRGAAALAACDDWG
jgi:hypothetical protein